MAAAGVSPFIDNHNASFKRADPGFAHRFSTEARTSAGLLKSTKVAYEMKEMNWETFKKSLLQAEKSPPALALHGLDASDAVAIIEHRIYRARLAQSRTIKILYDQESTKMERTLQKFFSSSRLIEEFEWDCDRPGTVWITLKLH